MTSVALDEKDPGFLKMGRGCGECTKTGTERWKREGARDTKLPLFSLAGNSTIKQLVWFEICFSTQSYIAV